MASKKKALLAAAGAAGGGIDYSTFIRLFTNANYDNNSYTAPAPYYDSDGNVYVAFQNTNFMYVASFDVDNVGRWARTIQMKFNGTAQYLNPKDMYVDDDVLYMLIGQGYDGIPLRLDATDGTTIGYGSRKFSSLNSGSSYGAVPTTHGYHVQMAWNSSNSQVGINVFSQTGSLVSVKYISQSTPNAASYKPKIDADNNIYLTYNNSNNGYAYLTKFNSSFDREWTVRANAGSGGLQSIYDIAVDSEAGFIYGACTFQNGDYRGHVVKWNTDGSKQASKAVEWYDLSGFPRFSNLSIKAICIGGDGNVYVGGYISRGVIYGSYEGYPGFVLVLDPDDLSYVDHFILSPDSNNHFIQLAEMMSPSYPNLTSQMTFFDNGNSSYLKTSFVFGDGMPQSLPRKDCYMNLYRDTDGDVDQDLTVVGITVNSNIIATSSASNGSITNNTDTVTFTNSDATAPATAGCYTELS